MGSIFEYTLKRDVVPFKCEEYPKNVIDAVDEFNNEIENIANAILSLKLEKNEHQLEVEYLYSLFREFKVINNIKNRRKAEDLLENVITQYGLMLQEKVHGKGEPT